MGRKSTPKGAIQPALQALIIKTVIAFGSQMKLSIRHTFKKIQFSTVLQRQHAFKSVWEQTLDPLGKNRTTKIKSSKPETWTVDWKRWPPNVPALPKGLKIPIKEIPQVDLRLSLSGQWHQITHGTTIVPINTAKKSFFDKLGGYLNLAQSVTFLVNPSSLLFLHSKAGQFYSVKLTISNSGTQPRRVRIVPPINPCFTVVRPIDPKHAISPGCRMTLMVHYRPKTDNSLNDVLILHIDGDGAIIVPLISACTPNPILEMEEWNCGCSTVGIPRTSYFDIKNVGGEGRFWILSEQEFNNQYLDCYIKYKRDVIKESTKSLVRRHTEAIIGINAINRRAIIGRGEASGLIKRMRDSLDMDFEDHAIPGQKKGKSKITPRIYTRSFRIQPSCFRLQRNQKVEIKVRYYPKDAYFHYEKLAIMCENGEVRWIAVKGLGIERDSDKLVEIKAHWTGPPIDLPTDPRTKFVLDCGDLISGELGVLNFTVFNRSCIPLYFFWSIRPVLTNPEESPENTEIKLMEKFYESTLYDQEGNSFFNGEVRENKDLESWVSLLPLTVSPAQGVLERKHEIPMTFTAECPTSSGYHACVISLFVEQVDEESKHSVVATLKELDKTKLNVPISHAELSKELPGAVEEKEKVDADDLELENNEQIVPTSDDESGEVESNDALDMYTNNELLEDNEEDEDEDGYMSLRSSIKEYRESLRGSAKTNRTVDDSASGTLLPLVVARKRSSMVKLESFQKQKEQESTINRKTGIDETRKDSSSFKRRSDGSGSFKLRKTKDIGEEIDPYKGVKMTPPKSGGSDGSKGNSIGRESLNIHYLHEDTSTEHDRSMNQGHGVFEDLSFYTENVIPQYKMWPNRDKTLTPVAEVEIWMNSVPLDVTFSPPIVIGTGLVKTQMERLITVRNATRHTIDITLKNTIDSSIAITCHPPCFTVKTNQKFTFKIVIYFEKCGEVRKFLNGIIALPFTTVPFAISSVLKAYGPYLEVLTPTLNFGIVPVASETMKTLAMRNGGNRPLKWIGRIAPEGMEDEKRREISGHQARIHDKRLVRIWPEWGVIDPGESTGLQVYFCAELHGQIATYVEVMVEGNPESLISVPVYGEIELPYLVLQRGRVLFNAESFIQQPIQQRTCCIINPSGFNVAFAWQCPMGRQSKLVTITVDPKQGTVPSKKRMDFSITVNSYASNDQPLELSNVYLPCCVEGMREPLILKVDSKM